MSFRKFARLSAATALCAVAIGGAAHAALVVRSVGTTAGTFPVGRQVTPGTPIPLAAGDMLTVLDGQTTRTFRGPGTFDLGRAAVATTTLAAASSALDAQTTARKPRLGTVRGIRVADTVSLWDVNLDTAGAGAHCVVDPATVKLRRTASATPLAFMITPASGSAVKPAYVEFSAGVSSQPWPNRLAADGSFTLKSGDASRTLKLVKIAAPTADPAANAQALIQAGCTGQLETYVKGLETGTTGR